MTLCIYTHVCVSVFCHFQTNDVFESIKDVARIHTPEPHAESNVERVSETSGRDVALLNSEQTLVSTKEKSTKDKVSICLAIEEYNVLSDSHEQIVI